MKLWVPVIGSGSYLDAWRPDIRTGKLSGSWSACIPTEHDKSLPGYGKPLVSHAFVTVSEADAKRITNAVAESAVPEWDRALVAMELATAYPDRPQRLATICRALRTSSQAEREDCARLLIHAMDRGLPATDAAAIAREMGIETALGNLAKARIERMKQRTETR